MATGRTATVERQPPFLGSTRTQEPIPIASGCQRGFLGCCAKRLSTTVRRVVPAPSAARSPFPLERFEELGFPAAGRFLWASGGRGIGTGLKPLEFHRDWLEQASGPQWAEQLRLRRELLLQDCGCVVWDDSGSEAAEEVLQMMLEWLPRRYPERYVLQGDTLRLPELDWRFDDVWSAKGLDALKLAATVVQEDLCLVSERSVDSREEAEAEAAAQSVHCFDAGVVCFSFDPRKRHKNLMAQVHRPVPGYEENLRRAVSRVFSALSPDKPLWRANWALQNNDEIVSTDLEWHPTNLKLGGRESRKLASSSAVFSDAMHTSYFDPLSEVPTTAEDAGRVLHVRVEYETLTRLRSTSPWSLFTVRTHLDPLDAFPPEAAQALASAIRSTSEGELRYKSLDDPALKRLALEFLDQRAEIGGLSAGTTLVDDPAPSNCPATRNHRAREL